MTFLCRENSIILRRARAGDGIRLALKLRRADRLELASSFPEKTPQELLEDFIAKSVFAVFAYEKEEPVFLGGLYPTVLLGKTACVWLLTGQSVEKRKIAFVKMIRLLLGWLWALYPELYNFIDERYLPSLRLISRLGGVFNGESLSFRDTRFLYFTFRRKQWEESSKQRGKKPLPL